MYWIWKRNRVESSTTFRAVPSPNGELNSFSKLSRQFNFKCHFPRADHVGLQVYMSNSNKSDYYMLPASATCKNPTYRQYDEVLASFTRAQTWGLMLIAMLTSERRRPLSSSVKQAGGSFRNWNPHSNTLHRLTSQWECEPSSGNIACGGIEGIRLFAYPHYWPLTILTLHRYSCVSTVRHMRRWWNCFSA